MLIRSQSKQLLIDLTGRVIGVSNEFIYVADKVSDRGRDVTFICQYKTAERAIEVLGEIQKSYSDMYTAAGVGGSFCVYNNKVFEMPEE